MSNEQPMCGIYKRFLSPGERHHHIRLAPEDLTPDDRDAKGQPIEPGLYQCGEEAYRHFQPRIARRLMKTPKISAEGRPVFIGDDGKPTDIPHSAECFSRPVMTIKSEDQAHGRILM